MNFVRIRVRSEVELAIGGVQIYREIERQFSALIYFQRQINNLES